MIAIIELYTKQKWIEPLTPGAYPYSLLYHQTMSYLLSSGETPAKKLFDDILSLSPFRKIPKEDYALLLRHLLAIGQLQKMEDGGLIIGPAGEKVVNDYHFLSVFLVPEYYLVKDENRAIGTVDKIYPPETRFALAGRTWETVEVNQKAKVIFVKLVPGVSTVDWDVDFQAELHTVLVRKMKHDFYRAGKPFRISANPVVKGSQSCVIWRKTPEFSRIVSHSFRNLNTLSSRGSVRASCIRSIFCCAKEASKVKFYGEPASIWK